MIKNKIKKEIELNGRTLSLEVGSMAPQANASVVVSYGETVVLVTATASEPREGIDFFPLRVDYEEKLYAGGVIKGSRFIKREGRPSDESVLAARLIDRSIRPFFPDDYYDDVQVIATILSVDGDNDPQLTSLIGAIAALEISDIPWEGSLGTSQVGMDENEEFILNPTYTQLEESSMKLLVSASKDRVAMVEAEAEEVSDEKVIAGIEAGRKNSQKVIDLISELKNEVGQEKYEYEGRPVNQELVERLENEIGSEVKDLIVSNPGKMAHDEKFSKLKSRVVDSLEEEFESKEISTALGYVQKKLIRKLLLEEGKRVDGRDLDEVRDLEIDAGVLPRTHGSALFKRGLTEALTILTLGSGSLEQLIESMEGEETKRYIHHYNSPPFSFGETAPIRGPGRREIGHGALAEKALLPVVPDEEDFPYTIRVVSEVLSQNGSSSMASTCGSSLALMDAGVPIKSHVAGVSVGLVEEGDDHVLLTDIIGLEDFNGDMDFKITGTKDGVTAIQLDVKNKGLTQEMVEKAVKQSSKGRSKIIDQMNSVISSPKEDLSAHAPRIYTMQIDPEKIGEVIGSGGKVIKGITEDTGAEIDIKDDGTILVSSEDPEGARKALDIIESITKEVEVGEIYEGEVVNILDFGAFVSITPNKDGLVHISELADRHVDKVEDVVNLGDKVRVKVIGVDDKGRINLSIKDLKDDQGSSDQ